MESLKPKKHIRILTSEETRKWHSPFSKEMRERHQSRMMAMCEKSAVESGCTHFELYDAHETMVGSGSVTA